ncbi:MAG: hydroxymethylbilane synthase [Candidatus Caldatribacteriota bacterium]
MKTYKIGTRGSLLAVTQCTLVKNELERLSGKQFELVLIKTQGDQIVDRPLWQLEGKDFFTKELDEALLSGQVDMVVHSYKDLGSIRPEGIKLAAITERKFAQDILLIRKDVLNNLKNHVGDFVVGTSSPRRIVNLSKNLAYHIPYAKEKNLTIRCETLRGNVNTRIGKLKSGQYHAITLALAGLERLASKEESKKELSELVDGLDYFVFPQTIFPSAASQGALGIEVRDGRDDNGELEGYISQLIHQDTVEEVKREREAFQSYGGGCHLAVGINVKKMGNHFVHIEVGEVDEKPIEKRYIEGITLPEMKASETFFGMPSSELNVVCDEFYRKTSLETSVDLSNAQAFVTTHYAIPTLKKSGNPLGLWAGGTKTAQRLTSEGYWVNGTSDSLGVRDLTLLKTSKALALFHDLSNWKVLSHVDATSIMGEVIGTYTRSTVSVSSEFENKLKNVKQCFWTSFGQYQAYISAYPHLKDLTHYCGMGKTYDEFNKAKIAVTPVISIQDFVSHIKD